MQCRRWSGKRPGGEKESESVVWEACSGRERREQRHSGVTTESKSRKHAKKPNVTTKDACVRETATASIYTYTPKSKGEIKSKRERENQNRAQRARTYLVAAGALGIASFELPE
eukprot:1739243-Rhodomonas_salina.1